MNLNKSKIAREFWRDIIDNNKIDLSNSDARKSVVNEFLNSAENKEAGWKGIAAEKRFFRLAFDKICRERGINVHQFGLKPEPKRVKTQTGKMNINIKTNEKPVHPLLQSSEEKKEEDQKEKEEQEKKKTLNTEQLQQQQQVAAIYTGQSVGQIFAMMFNIVHSRFKECSPLTPQEVNAMGEAWYPIFNEYLGGTGGKWVMPIIVTAPIVIQRAAEFQRAQKEKELSEEIKKDLPEGFQPPEDIPDEPVESKKNKNWTDKL